MKCNSDTLKAGVEQLLKQAGYSMQDMERYLAQEMTEPEMEKFAANTMGTVGDLLGALLTGGAALSAGIGGLAGLGGYGAYHGLSDSQKRSDEAEAERNKYVKAREALLAAKGSGTNLA